VLLLVPGLTWACGDDAGPVDAAVDAAVDSTVVSMPDPPIFTPCPPGWLEVVDGDGLTICEPWAAPPPATCGADEGVFVGEEGCVRVGSACPSSDFPEDLPAGARVYYVRAGEPAGGDGSIDAPFGRVGDALGRAFSGSIIALSKGEHVGIIRPPNDGVTLFGACVAETTLRAEEVDDRGGVLEVRESTEIVVQNLRFVASPRNAIICRNGCELTVRDVVVEEATGFGIFAINEGTLTVESSVVRDTAPAVGGLFGRGLSIENGSTGVVRRVSLERNREVGMRSFAPGSTLVAEDVYIRDTLAEEADGSFGRGFTVEQGASAELSRVVIERARDMGIFVDIGGTTLTGRDLIIRDIESQERGLIGGRGINVQDGAVVDLERVRIERAREIGIGCIGDVSATLRDVVVRDTREQESDLRWGRGIAVTESARLSLERTAILRSIGLAFANGESTVTAEHLWVKGVSLEACVGTTCPTGGLGIGVGSYLPGATTDVRTFVVEDAATCGVQIAAQGQLDLTSGVIRGNAIGACVQVEEYDLGRLQSNVVYSDNDTSLDFTELPVPDTDF